MTWRCRTISAVEDSAADGDFENFEIPFILRKEIAVNRLPGYLRSIIADTSQHRTTPVLSTYPKYEGNKGVRALMPRS
jgi:hypothetical protein